jgi:hypothetical protein
MSPLRGYSYKFVYFYNHFIPSGLPCFNAFYGLKTHLTHVR